MDKRTLYRTAIVTIDMGLPGITQGDVVAIIRYHDYNDTYTVRSIAGVLQCMIPACYLSNFVL